MAIAAMRCHMQVTKVTVEVNVETQLGGQMIVAAAHSTPWYKSQIMVFI